MASGGSRNSFGIRGLEKDCHHAALKIVLASEGSKKMASEGSKIVLASEGSKKIGIRGLQFFWHQRALKIVLAPDQRDLYIVLASEGSENSFGIIGL